MKKVNAVITCMATYTAVVEVPDEITSLEEAAEYINNNMSDIPLGTLTYVSGSDNEVTEDDCSFVE